VPALTKVARKVEALLRGRCAVASRMPACWLAPANASLTCRLASGSGSADRGASASTDSFANRAAAGHHRSLGTRELIYDAAASGKPRVCETRETASQGESALRNCGGPRCFVQE